MNEKKYKLVGVFNLFDVYPMYLLPVFRDEDGNYCGGFIYDDNSPYLETFQGFFPKYLDNRIMFLEDLKNNPNIKLELDNIKDEYQIGDLAIEAMNPCKGTIYIGTSDKFVEYARKQKERIEAIYYGKDLEARNNLIKNEFQGHENNVEHYLHEIETELEDVEHRLSSLRK